MIDEAYDYTRAKSYLSTFNARTCTGITFFTYSGTIFAIHAHTSAQPSAQSTFETLSGTAEALARWIYIPIGPQDLITAFGWSGFSAGARFYVRIFDL